MKKLFLFTVFLMVMFTSTIVQAEVNEDSFTVTPFAGGYFFEGNENQRSLYTVGLRAGYNITANIGVEGYFHYVPSELRDVPNEPWQNVYGYGVEGLYHFFPESRFVPFIAVGLGCIHYGYPEQYRLTKFAVEYGGGLKYFISSRVADFFFADNIALRADVRHVIPFNDRYNDLLCTFGIEFSFGAGGKEKITPKEPTAQSEEVAPKAEAPAPVEEVAPSAGVPAPVEEVAPKAEVPVPVEEVAAAPPVVVISAPVENTQSETKSTLQEDIQNLVTKWLNSWRTGDMETYRSCYASDFHSKGKDLDDWIIYKTNVRKRSKNITINIDSLQVSVEGGNTMVTFTQSYSSSILKDKGKKTLELKKINNQWKIYREVMWS